MRRVSCLRNLHSLLHLLDHAHLPWLANGRIDNLVQELVVWLIESVQSVDGKCEQLCPGGGVCCESGELGTLFSSDLTSLGDPSIKFSNGLLQDLNPVIRVRQLGLEVSHRVCKLRLSWHAPFSLEFTKPSFGIWTNVDSLDVHRSGCAERSLCSTATLMEYGDELHHEDMRSKISLSQ